jgi:hypothetical protein
MGGNMKHIDISEEMYWLEIDYDTAKNPSSFIAIERENELLLFDEDCYDMWIIVNEEDLKEFIKEQDEFVGMEHTDYWFENRKGDKVEIFNDKENIVPKDIRRMATSDLKQEVQYMKNELKNRNIIL